MTESRDDQPNQPRTGWSKAAKRRAGLRRKDGHPLGDVKARGQGYTVYSDTSRGTDGEVQIWDES